MIKHIYIKIGLLLIFAIEIQAQTFYSGADISFTPQIYDVGGKFKEDNQEKQILDILKAHGINSIRLRLWHTPTEGYCNLAKTLDLAKQIKERGLKFMLDIHYSDWWADPANQTKPAAWKTLSVATLNDSVYSYTKNVITAFKNRNIKPDFVQIGNETTSGMLWDDGKVGGTFETPEHWTNFTNFLKNGIKAVKDVDTSIKTIIHISEGGKWSTCNWIFGKLASYQVNYDIIGLSYYPWWHGTLANLQENLNNLATVYKKNIIVVETAYPFTLGWNDNTNNLVGMESQLLTGYSATVEGQKKYLTDVIDIIKKVPNGLGKGLFYWEPDALAITGFQSSTENLNLFDFQGNLLNSVDAFKDLNSNEKREAIKTFELEQNYPNPFNPSTVISYQIPDAVGSNGRLTVLLKIYDILGKEVATLVNEKQNAGSYSLTFNTQNLQLSSGIYIAKLNAGSFFKSVKMMLVK